VAVEHEPLHAVVEAAELPQQIPSGFGMPLDRLKLVLLERRGLPEDRSRNRKLADVVQEPADRECPQTRRGQAHLLSERHGQCGHTPRVLLG
jgi:hypothetical protein